MISYNMAKPTINDATEIPMQIINLRFTIYFVLAGINSFNESKQVCCFFASVPLGDILKQQTCKQPCFQYFLCCIL